MIFNKKEITLKNGNIAVLRNPEISDAHKMINYLKTACGETEFLARNPEEINMTVESEKAWIQNAVHSPNILMITCFVDGEVVGNCEINFRTGMKTGHRASVAIAILKKYWNIGIGSAMFCELIAAAKAHGTEIMELEFIEGNERARHLYEKFGFMVIAEKPKAIKQKDGRLVSEFLMQKKL